MRVLWIVTAFVMLTNPVQSQSRIPIYLASKTKDSVGQQYAYHLREAIAGSTRYRLINSFLGAKFMVDVVSVDPSEGLPSVPQQIWTACSVVLMDSNGVMMTHSVIIVGSNVVQQQAMRMMASIDEDIREQ
jgi:hypothetical protein